MNSETNLFQNAFTSIVMTSQAALERYPELYVNGAGELRLIGERYVEPQVPAIKPIYPWEIPKQGLGQMHLYTGASHSRYEFKADDDSDIAFTERLSLGHQYEHLVAYLLDKLVPCNVFIDSPAKTIRTKEVKDQMDICCAGLGIEVKSQGCKFYDNPDSFPVFHKNNPKLRGKLRVDRADVIDSHVRERVAVVFVSQETEAMLYLPYEPQRDDWEVHESRDEFGRVHKYYYVSREKLKPFDSLVQLLHDRYNKMRASDQTELPVNQHENCGIYPSCPYDYSFARNIAFKAPSLEDMMISEWEHTENVKRAVEERKASEHKAFLSLLDF